MKAVLLEVGEPADTFAALVAAARAAGHRVGWLDFHCSPEAPGELEAAVAAGALRAVAAGSEGTLALKAVRGVPVLRDLLREHFRGCRLVLVAGTVGAPRLEPHGDGWSVVADAAVRRRSLTTDELVKRLSRARPFD